MDQALTKLWQWALAFAAMLASTLVLLPGRADAGINSCSVSSAGLAFSEYNSQTKAAVDGAGTITVTCTGDGSNNNLSLNLVGGNSGACSPRRMQSGANLLAYQIFQDAARSAALCDGGSRMDINIDFSSGSSQTRDYTIYGRVTAGQNPPYGPGYADALTIQLKRGGGTLATATLNVTGGVAAICTVSAGTLGFGSYNGTAAALATAPVTVNCSNGASYQVSMGAGANASGGTRRMAGPAGGFLAYELYSNSARTLAWGDGSALGARVGATGSGSNQSLTVYGRIPAGQNPAAGAYADSVMITVDY